MKDRNCFACRIQLHFKEFRIMAEEDLDKDDAIKNWNSPYVKIFCCKCHYIITANVLSEKDFNYRRKPEVFMKLMKFRKMFGNYPMTPEKFIKIFEEIETKRETEI